MKIKSLKQFNFKLQALLLCGICSGGILSSCSSEDIGNKTNSEVGKQLVLTINTANPNGPQASALPNTLKNVKIGSRATNLTPTAGETPGDDKNENQINRLTVGVFSSDGNTVRTIQEYTKDGANKFTQSGTTTTATVTTTSLAKDDKVLVAVNAPAKLFAGVQNATAFAKATTIDEVLTTPAPGETADNTKEATDNIPMYGESTIAQAEEGSYSSTVHAQHQVAKITVATVSVDFDPNGPYKDAIFQPIAFFLTNVPDNLNFTTTAATGSSTVWQQGGDASVTATYKAYLGTGDLTTYAALKIGGTTSDAINKFFYTMPNSVVANNTKLVIKGKFSADGSAIGEATPVVYYPVNINWVYGEGAAPDGGTAKTVSPNKNYVCSVTIKTKGADSSTQSIDPSAASLTVTVKGFDEADQTTIFE